VRRDGKRWGEVCKEGKGKENERKRKLNRKELK
jgi:hypothetical protein